MLERRHPLAKLACAVVLVLAASLLDHVAGLALIAGTILLLLVGTEHRAPGALLRRMLPFGLLALAMSWIYLVAENPAHRAVGGSGAAVALLVASRILTMGVVSLAFAETTRPDALARALEQNAGLSRRVVQGVLAAVQFLPALAEDYRIMRLMQQARVEGSGWGARIRRFVAGLAPDLLLLLLAGALRRADTAALSMQLRGLDAGSSSPAWRRQDFDVRDAITVAAALALALAAAAVS